MCQFFQKYIRQRQFFTDTDSLVYENKVDNIYEEFYENKNLLDLSKYPENSNFFDPVNKTNRNEVGMKRCKDEVKRKMTIMYSLVIVNNEEI